MGAPAPVFHGTVTQEGKLLLAPEEAPDRRAHLRLLKGFSVDVVITKHTDTRSLRANAFYWGHVLQTIHDHTGQDKQDVHDAMCEMFLDNQRKQVEFLNILTGEVVEVPITKRSSGLKGDEFFNFVERVRQWAREFLGVETHDPDPEYWRGRE